MKRIVFVLVFVFVALSGFAQSRKISGVLLDKDTGEGMPEAAVQLLKADSTFVTGTVASDKGEFSVIAPEDGKYIIRVSNVGYKDYCRNVAVKNEADVSLGHISLKAEAIMLKGAQVTAQAAKVTVKADTFVYNASAYRTPEGSVVEELVKKLPGAQVDDDGKITINGKEVKKILVDGKEFMTGDTQTAMKNLPTSMINDIKAYDQKSDLARISGIDDGEEQTVLDFGIKKGMNRGIFGNLDLSGGTQSRYAERGMGAYFTGKSRLMTFLNFNNTNDMGFPGGGPGGRWGNREGLNTKKMVGVNYNYEEKDKLKLDLSARWNRTDGDVQKTTATKNFVSTASAYENAKTSNYTRQNNFNFRGRLEWHVDSMVTIMFRPTASLTWNDGKSTNSSVAYRTNPYSVAGLTNPWDIESAEALTRDSLVNSQYTTGITYSRSTNVGARAELNWKLNTKGRNITISENASYTDSPSKSISASDVTLYQIKTAAGNDSTYYTNRYNVTPQSSWSTATKFTYTEPLAQKLYLQLGYQFQYKHTKSDRSTYDFSKLSPNPWDRDNGIPLEYRGWSNYLSHIPGNYEEYLDKSLSKYSEYNNYIHNIELVLRFVREKFKMNVGVLYQPQSSTLKYKYMSADTIVKRHVANITPTLDLRYQPNKVTQLRVEYRGSTSQPSMTDLLPITDNSDPMNIATGNPDLKPSFTNNLHSHFNTFIENHQQAMMAFVHYSNTRNAVASRVTYDNTTGGKTTKPENINGNWNIDIGGMYNVSIDSAGVWNWNMFTMVKYNNYVGYLYQNQQSLTNTTRSTMVMPRMQASYRKSWGEIGIDGSFTYTHTRNELQPTANLDTWQFSYGGSLNLYAPWGTSLSTDLHNQCRRGYSDNSMNTNELVWNAQISQSFLTGKSLIVSLQWYDILRKQSNYSRTISAMSMVDTESNAINSYGMIKVTYRFNFFGGKKAREKMESEFPGPPPGMRGHGGGRPMGPPPGHF